MSKNKKQKQDLQKKLSEVPNPPVPNRAHTEMSVKQETSNKSKDCR